MGIYSVLSLLLWLNMNKNQETFAVVAICLSIIIAGAIIAYKPAIIPDLTSGLPESFRFPSGIGISQGLPTIYGDVSQGTDLNLKTISLTGSGSASAQSDQATVDLGVQITSESANDAIRENAEKMTYIIEAIKALGISEDDIVTTSYSVYPQYDWTEKGRIFRGYTVTNLVQITINDLEIVGDVIDAAADAGANQINGISFGLSDEKREELKTNAYITALTDAQVKANVIADTLELSITGVQSVTESSYVPVRNYAYEESMDGGQSYAPTPILSGELTVTVNVNIVFLFE
jgi:uncharacterized protein YggE